MITVNGKTYGDVVVTPGSGKGTIEIGGSGARYPIYDGPTTVIPEPDEMQILQTGGKVVQENVLVMPIPYFETSNPQGGKTVYIGE